MRKAPKKQKMKVEKYDSNLKVADHRGLTIRESQIWLTWRKASGQMNVNDTDIELSTHT